MGYHNLSELIKVTELSERAGDVGLWNKPGTNLRRAQTAPQSSLLITGHFPTCLNLTFSCAVQKILLSAVSHRTQKDLPAQSNALQPGPTHIHSSHDFGKGHSIVFKSFHKHPPQLFRKLAKNQPLFIQATHDLYFCKPQSFHVQI